jgi:7-cyano-7-deazaguanine synthase
MDANKALVLFSGGQDSATCLAWALDRYGHVETIGFDYRQRHAIELEVRQEFLRELLSEFPDWATRLHDDHVINIHGLADLGDTAMTKDLEIIINKVGLPSTFVPGRNIVFLTFAAALAYRRGAKHIVTGVCETDYSGYPDCRDDTIKALQAALNLGMESRFVLHTPLMWIDKAKTWELGLEIGGNPLIELIKKHTHTCYLGDRSKQNEWGYGCGKCPACELRKSGFRRFDSITQSAVSTK